MLIVGAGVIVVLLVGGYFFINGNKPGATPAPSVPATHIALATPTPAPTEEITATPTEEPTVAPTEEPTVAPKPTPTQANDVPASPWTTYTAPDGSWSAMFPAKPETDQESGTGDEAGYTMVFYYAIDDMTSSGYYVATIDTGSLVSLSSGDLDEMADEMSSSLGGGSGTVVNSGDTTLDDQPAKEFLIQSGNASSEDFLLVMTVADTRVYMVMSSGLGGPGQDTDYFLANFSMK